MKISKELLIRESSRTGFRVEILEKVWHLMNVLEGINAHPFLQERLVLKGGTALNLFIFDLPRLSVDIDLNYIGMPDREGMMRERLLIEKGADIHSADSSGLTPFQVAVSMNNKKIADLLISRGVRKIAPPGTGYANYYNMYLQLPPN